MNSEDVTATIEIVRKASNEYMRHLLDAGEPWELHAVGDLPDEYEKTKLIASLNALGNPFSHEEIDREFGIEQLDGRASMIQLGRILTQSLVQDIRECLTQGQQHTLEKCHFSMVDIGEANALCANRDIAGNKLPGFVILVNQGLYFCLKLLVTAQIYEDLQGDFAQFQRSGTELFTTAYELFLSQRPKNINVGAVYTGNEEVDGTIEAHVSLAATLVMQFVLLHEVGHAHLNHGELLSRARLQALSLVDRSVSVTDTFALHQAELDADAFAWQALARRANDPMKNFANLYVIRLFFGFLAEIEQRLGGRIAGSHPSATARMKGLEVAYAPNGFTVDETHLLVRQDYLISCWSGRPFE